MERPPHETSDPADLTSIRGYSDLYRRGGLDDEEWLDDAMRRLNRALGHMGDLADELLLARPTRVPQSIRNRSICP